MGGGVAAGAGVAGGVYLVGGGVDREQRRGGDGAARAGDMVASGFEVPCDVVWDAGVESEATGLGGCLGEGADVVVGREAGGGDGGLGVEVTVDEVQENLKGDLILVVAAGDADGDDGFAIVEDEGGREGNARTFAGLDGVGMVRLDAEALEAGAEPDAGIACEDAGPARGRRGDDVAPAIGDETSGGVVGRVGWAGVGVRRCDGLIAEGIARAKFLRGVGGVDEEAANLGVAGIE